MLNTLTDKKQIISIKTSFNINENQPYFWWQSISIKISFIKEQDKESTRSISNEWANILQHDKLTFEIGERSVHI